MSQTSGTTPSSGQGGGSPKDYPHDPNQTPQGKWENKQYTKHQESRVGRAVAQGVQTKDYAYPEKDSKHDQFAAKKGARP